MNAVYIAKYLRKLFLDNNNSDNGIIDLFIETYFNDHDFNSSGQIYNITNEFIYCTNNIDINERKKCFNEYKKLRYHYGDFRRDKHYILNTDEVFLTVMGAEYYSSFIRPTWITDQRFTYSIAIGSIFTINISPEIQIVETIKGSIVYSKKSNLFSCQVN